jgi:hypothetical protein
MAKYELNVPNLNITNQFGEYSPEVSSDFKKKLDNLNKQYGGIIYNSAVNSFVPSELIKAMIIALSNGENNKVYKSVDNQNRSGLFSLSNKTAKQILSRERALNRMTLRELEYLTKANPKVGVYLSNKKGVNLPNYNYLTDFKRGLANISDTENSWDLTNPQLSIAIGTIWLGQIWDMFSKSNNPIDKVIITALLPNNDKGWLSGNDFVKPRPFTTDYTKKEDFNTLPKPLDKNDAKNIINPDGGFVGESLNKILNRNGLLYVQTKK